MLPGAVLCRVAASHLRVGTFQYASAQTDPTLLRRLVDHAIDRQHPQAADAANPHLALLEAVAELQAPLIARWMLRSEERRGGKEGGSTGRSRGAPEY